MKLMTEKMAAQIKPFGYFEQQNQEPLILVKYFDPTSQWRWFVVEGERQDDGDWLFFGFVEGFERELGYFTLSQLEHAKDGFRGLQSIPIERDLHYGNVPLKQVMEN